MLDVKKRFGDHPYPQSAGDDLFYLEVNIYKSIAETVIPFILLSSALVFSNIDFIPCFLMHSSLSLFVYYEHFEKHFNINQENTIPTDLVPNRRKNKTQGL